MDGLWLLVICIIDGADALDATQKFSFIPATLGLFAVMLTLPAFGSIMNGFAGPYNRWTFAIPLFVSLGAAILYNSRFNLKKKKF